MQKYVRARTPPFPRQTDTDTNEDFEFNRERCDLFDTNAKINYEEMLKNGLEKRKALIQKRRRSRTPPHDRILDTETETIGGNCVPKYIFAALIVSYFFWILFK